MLKNLLHLIKPSKEAITWDALKDVLGRVLGQTNLPQALEQRLGRVVDHAQVRLEETGHRLLTDADQRLAATGKDLTDHFRKAAGEEFDQRTAKLLTDLDTRLAVQRQDLAQQGQRLLTDLDAKLARQREAFETRLQRLLYLAAGLLLGAGILLLLLAYALFGR